MMMRGEHIQAIVETIFPYGVFCRILKDGSRGYIRRRELTLSGQADPRQVLQTGQTIDVVVRSLPSDGRMAELSLRLAQPDPWPDFLRQTKTGDTLVGTVKYVHPDRATVEIRPGVDGVIYLDDLAVKPIRRPEEVLWPGDRIIADVVRLDAGARRLQMGIRQYLERKQFVGQVMDWMKTMRPDIAAESLEPDPPADYHPAINFKERILVAEDDPAVREALVDWLTREGCLVEGCENAQEAQVCFEHCAYSVLITDINMPGMNGIELVRSLIGRAPKTIYCFLSDIDQIAQFGKEIEELKGYIFVKPFETDEIRLFFEGLNQGVLPQHEQIVPKSEHGVQLFSGVAATMRGKQSLAERLTMALNFLLAETNAEKAVLFHYDPLSRLVSVEAEAGSLPIQEELINNLVASPVEDVITEDTVIWENRISNLRNDAFRKLQEVITFESCIGVPVLTGGERNHALFIFHRLPESFSRYRIRDVQTCSALISIALEEEKFRSQVRDSSALLLNGQLSSAFNHEVYNKVSVLTVQLEILNSSYRDLSTAFPMVTESQQMQKLNKSLGEVGQAVRTLNRLAEDFRQIMRGGGSPRVDIGQVVQQACEQVKPTASKYSVAIYQDKPEQQIQATFNRFALIYVVYNLLLNAVQLLANRANERSVHIKTSLENRDGQNLVVIRITDTGPGIHRQMWEKIFDMGYTTRSNGSGLGLYIARSLTETYGGTICVEESLIEGGTTFKIELPEGMETC